jgi:dipeptidyl aminopeptidase/acylaminoacyl peptidase
MRAHAEEYGIRSDRIGAMGASAGGHLSLLLGTMDPADGFEGNGGYQEFSSKVQAVVNYFGPTELTLSDWDPQHDHLLVDFLGGKLHEQRPRYRQASPTTYLDERDAPVITFHGTHDTIVPYGQAILLDRLLRQRKIPTHLEVMVGANHGWLGLELLRTQKLAIDFLDRHLK